MNQEFKEISNTIKNIDPIIVKLRKINVTEDIELALARLTQGFNEYKRFFLTYHDIINNYVFFKNSSNSIINSLIKLESKIPKTSNLLLNPEYNHDYIKNIQTHIFKIIKIIDDAIDYCKNNKNYNLSKPLQDLESTSRNLINIYKNLYPVVSKNNQLKNFFLENKNILYINQEVISKLNTLSNIKNNEDTYKKIDEIIDEIIETFNKTLEIEYRNLNGSVDNLYYQMLSLYRTRISLIDYQKDLSLNLETEKAEIHNLIDNYKNQIKDTKESLINTIEINKDNLTTYNKNLNNLINEQERKTADQSTKIQSNKIAIDTLTQTLENEITRQKSNIRTSLEDTATDLKNDIKNTKQSLDKDATELNLTMKRYRKIISLSTSEIMLQKFKTNSRIEMWTYYILNLVSLGIVFFLVLESYQSIEAYISKDIKELVERDFHYIILKISLTVISFFILIFISRISNKAHYHWKHNENIYLKLYALKPYISEMSPEKQLEIQEKLIDVYFGKENSSEKKDTDLPENISQIVKTLIEKLPLEISKKDDEK